MKALTIIALLPLALAACGDVAPSPAGNGIRVANPDSDRMKAASPIDQRLALMRAIRDTGNRCHRVVTGAYQEYYRGMEMWVALCDDGKHWSVFIAGNSDVQVRDCAQHVQLGLPQCRPVAPPPPDPNDPVDNPQVNAMIAGVTALGRAGLPDDVGGAVAALLSEGSNWITGQRIEVSGGMML